MKWGCHSFGGIHAIFAMYDGSSLKTRLEIIKKAIFTPGIFGFVYSNRYGASKKLENEIELMGNYGIVHGNINNEQHNYYRNEDEPMPDELTKKLKNDIKFFEQRRRDIEEWYKYNDERLQLAIDSTKCRLREENE